MSEITIIEAEPVSPVEPAPSPVAAAPAPADPPSRLTRWLPIVAVSLASLASFLSVIGLTVASRTIANASLVVADARERREQLVRVGTLIDEVEALRARELAALERIEQVRSTAPATTAEVRRAIDGLKHDLAKHENGDSKLSLVRAGQSELAERIGQISLKLERIEMKLSATRQASAAAGRAPIS